MKKVKIFIFLLGCLFLIGNLKAQPICEKPTNLRVTQHDPSWYDVKLAWEAPTETNAGIVFDNGSYVTHPGEGPDGTDLSITLATQSWLGRNVKKKQWMSVADDFTLSEETTITSIDFFAFGSALFTIPESPVLNDVSVRIYNKKPNEAGSAIIWGDFTDNIIIESSFDGAYRVNNNYPTMLMPIFRIRAGVSVTLQPGTYWLAVTIDNDPHYSLGMLNVMPASVEDNPVGNAIGTSNFALSPPSWVDWTDKNASDVVVGLNLPFVIRGVPNSEVVGYNVYRDDVKLNTSLLTTASFRETLMTGIYTYEVSAVWLNDCESGPITQEIVMEADMCETPVTVFPFIEGFEEGESWNIDPANPCWKQSTIGGLTRWERKKNYVGSLEPDEAHSGNYRMGVYWTAPATLGAATATLTSPMLNLSALTNPSLEFWHVEPGWDGQFDTLSVYYKTSLNGEWTRFLYYPSATNAWKVEKILLPNPTSTYWIMFTSNNFYGYGTQIDDIYIGEAPTYAITATAGANGSISPAGTTTVSLGGSQAYTITADAGYKIKSVLVDGTAETAAVGASSYSYTFSNVTANHTISAEFEQITYTIAATSGSGGSINPAGTATVTHGNNQTYTITANAGYKIKSVLVDGTAETAAVGASSYSYTFSNVTANHTISAEFEQSIFTITATADANGTIAPNGATTLTYGETQEYTITANEGYKIKSVLVDDVAETAAVGASSYSYTFSNVTADHTISAEFEQITYTITATAGTNGSISPAGTTTVSYGSNQAYTITASNDYLIKEVKVDGVAESAAVGKTTYSYTFTNVTANHTISAEFEIATPELKTITINDHSQTVSSAMTYMAACGEQSISMTLTAVGEVKVNGAAYTNGSPISLTSDKTVITITVTAGSNTATYTLTVAKAIGDATPLYIERWGATIAIVNNPANNGGYTFDQIQWYKASDNTPAGTGAYVVGNISTHYADVHAVETGAWHHTCRTKATPAPVQIVVYPNPVLATQTLNVNLPEGLNEVNIDVYDINGKLVKQHPRVTTTLTAPAGTGIYVLKIQLPDGSITTEKIVVK